MPSDVLRQFRLGIRDREVMVFDPERRAETQRRKGEKRAEKERQRQTQCRRGRRQAAGRSG
jgi:hypothetical protein